LAALLAGAAPVTTADRADVPLANAHVIRRVTVLVRDLDAAVAFYADGLGMTARPVRRFEGGPLARALGLPPDARMRFVELDSARGTVGTQLLFGSKLGLIALEGPAAARAAPSGPGSVLLSIRVADARATYARVRERGHRVVVPVVAEQPGLWQFALFDPDGNRVAVYSMEGAD